MTHVAHKITLSSSKDIPFNKLALSQSNVRKIKVGVSVEELAEDIARRGLLQSLNVRPVIGEDGAETGMFEIPAGGRRYQALALLVKQKRLAKTAPVPCVVRDPRTVILAEDDSLAENTQRAPLHPLDQFRAFLGMQAKGMTEEEIASAFFTTVNVVKQRLRLASVSATLLDVYTEDGMTLDMLMAFTVNSDHQRQEQVWDAIKDGWSKQPHQIRRMLTETTVAASDRRVRFVGLKAYKQSGGTVLRDLFQADEGGWLQDVPLLDRLVSEKLKTIADEIGTEGWKWVTVDLDLPYGYGHGLRILRGTVANLSDEERATREALRTEYEQLEADHQHADELPDAVDTRLAEIEAALEAFEQRSMIYDPADLACAGVFVSLDYNGNLIVDRGYVRPEDEAPGDEEAESAKNAGVADGPPIHITIGGQQVPAEDADEDVLKPLPDRLLMELTAYRTLALRNAVAEHPHVALTALLHKLVRERFGHMHTQGDCMEAFIRETAFSVQGEDLKDSPAAKAIQTREDAWQADIPLDDDGKLWDWLHRLEDASRLALLAHCVSYGINALYEKPNPHGGSGVSKHGLECRLSQADHLARATGLDMVEAGWRPTARNYLDRVTKPRILDAVREGAGERAAQLIDHLKKGDMATEAERLLAETGWLPEPLRLVVDKPAVVLAEIEAESEALPAFLVAAE